MQDRARRESELEKKRNDDRMMVIQEALQKAQAELTALRNAPAAMSAVVTASTGSPVVTASTGSSAVSAATTVTMVPPAVSAATTVTMVPPAMTMAPVAMTMVPPAVTMVPPAVTMVPSAATTDELIVSLLEQLVHRSVGE